MNIPWMRDYNHSLAQELIEYEKLEVSVKQITGYDFKCLLKLFSMGYTLKPPDREISMSEILELVKEENYA